MTDNQTLAVYDEKINDYIKLTEAPPSKSLLAFIQAVPSGGRVLDLGCGPGGAAAEMAQCGLKVDAIDGSQEMVDAAKKYLKVTAWKATFHDLTNHPTYVIMSDMEGGRKGVILNAMLDYFENKEEFEKCAAIYNIKKQIDHTC